MTTGIVVGMPCSIDGCERPVHGHGWCNTHYRRWQRHGDPLWQSPRPGVEEKFWRGVGMGSRQPHMATPCWEWMRGRSGGYGSIRGGQVTAHRASYQLHVGPIPVGSYVDHRCHNRGCVRPDHLRLATNKQNQENLSGPHQDSSSGVRGVSWEKGRWRACVVHDGHKINVGRFVTLDEAEAAVRAKRLELFTHNDLDRT